MTLPKLMPDEVGIVAFKDGTYDCYPNLANVPPSTSYTRTDLYTAALAERDALRALCEGMAENIGQVLDWLGDEMFDDDVREKRHHDTTQEERAENISDMLRDMLTAYEKHKEGV